MGSTNANVSNKKTKNIWKKWMGVNKHTRMQTYLTLGLILLLVLFEAVTQAKFFKVANVKSVLSSTIFLVLGGFGMMFIFGTGILDLSLGANILLSGCLGAFVGKSVGGVGGLILMFVVTVACSILFGQISVQCTLSLHIPAWISGLGAGLILEAILNIWQKAVTSLPNIASNQTLRFFGKEPGMYILVAVAIVIAFIVYNKTTFGINLQSVGGNALVSKNMGINVKKTVLISTIVGGAFVGLAALFNVSNTGFVTPQLNLGSMNTIFRLLAVIMLADALSVVFSQPIAICYASLLVAAFLNVFVLLTGKTSTELNFFLGILVILAGVISHIGTKGVVK